MEHNQCRGLFHFPRRMFTQMFGQMFAPKITRRRTDTSKHLKSDQLSCSQL